VPNLNHSSPIGIHEQLSGADNRVPVVVDGVVTGTAARIIDFSNEPPIPPVVMMPVRVRGRFMVGHTRSFDDPDAPVLVFEDEMRTGPGEVDARCRSCNASSQLGPLGGDTLLLIEHETGCRTMAELARKAGRS
jgi:hypothetical protein